MKNNKVAGIYRLPVEFYKNSTVNEQILEKILKHFNKLMKGTEVSSTWGTGVVCPLFKNKGSINDPNNYRGITLLSVISKIYTKILATRIQLWVKHHNIIIPAQAGFRKGFSTIKNVFVIRTLVDTELRKKRGKLYECYIGFQKAFGEISREALFFKLKFIGMSRLMIQRIKHLFKKVEFSVKMMQGKMTRTI